MPDFNTIGFLHDPAVGIDSVISVETSHSLDEPEGGFIRLHDKTAHTLTYYRHVEAGEADLELTLLRHQERVAAAKRSWAHLLEAFDALKMPVEIHALGEGVQLLLKMETHPGWHAILYDHHEAGQAIPALRENVPDNRRWFLHVYSGVGGTEAGEDGYAIPCRLQVINEGCDERLAQFVAPLLHTLAAGARSQDAMEHTLDQLARLGD